MISGLLQRDAAAAGLNSGRARLVVLFATGLACGLSLIRDVRLVLPIDHLLDFGAFLASGKAAFERLNPYGVYPLVPTFVWNGHEAPGVNLNPPVSLFLFGPLAMLSPETALHIWTALTIAAYAAAVALLAWAHPEIDRITRGLWAVSAWAIWSTLQLGQLYALLALLTTIAWVCLERRRMLVAGVALGVLVALKPNFAVWPVLLLLGAERRAFVWTFLVAGLLSALAAIAFGTGVYTEWLSTLSINSLISIPSNGSLVAAGTRLGLPMVGYAASAALLVGIAVLVHKVRPDARGISRLALPAALLASPIAWVGYGLVLLPLFFSRRWTLPLVLLAAFWTLPDSFTIAGFQNSGWHFWVFGFAYCLALLAMMAHQMYDVFGMRRLLAPFAYSAPYLAGVRFQSLRG